MQRRTVALAACLLVVALAGCNTGGGGETVTPAPVPVGTTTPEPIPGPDARPNATIDGVAFPPGADGRGIVNTRQLLAAHERAAGGQTYRLTVDERVVTDGTATADRRIVVRMDERRQRSRVNWTNASQRRVRYSDGQGRYTRLVRENDTAFYRTWAVDFERLQRDRASVRLPTLLGAGRWRASGTTERDGRPAVVFDLVRPARRYENASGRLVVTSDGVVRSGRLRAERGDRRRTITYRFDPVDGVDITVPPWLYRTRIAGG